MLLRDMKKVEMKTLTQFTNRLRNIGYALQDDNVISRACTLMRTWKIANGKRVRRVVHGGGKVPSSYPQRER